jgi:hypothetical protein
MLMLYTISPRKNCYIGPSGYMSKPLGPDYPNRTIRAAWPDGDNTATLLRSHETSAY